MLFAPGPLDEIKKNVHSHKLGVQQQNKFRSRPLGPEEESKDQISLNYNNKFNSKDFFYTQLCVFLQIKDIKHIERNFCSDAWVIPQGCDMLKQGVQRVQKWSCGISN